MSEHNLLATNLRRSWVLTIALLLCSVTALAVPNGLDGVVYTMTVYDGDLYVGGRFTAADAETALRIARWDGVSWHGLGGGMDGIVYALAVYEGELVAAGDFSMAGGVACSSGVAAWDGSSWGCLSGALPRPGSVRALCVWDDKLIAGGNFGWQSQDPSDIKYLAMWDGVSWSHFDVPLDGSVRMLAQFQGELFAGGSFQDPAGYIARWDGSVWHPLGSAFNGVPLAATVYDAKLVVGGDFTEAGGIVTRGIAAWDGSWHTLADGVYRFAMAVTAFGDALIAGGAISSAGGVPARGVASWDGAAWHPLGEGTVGTVRALDTWQGSLIVGGDLTQAGDIPVSNIARWDGTEWHDMSDINGCEVRIGATHTSFLGEHDWISITAEGFSTDFEIGSFDFLMSFDPIPITFTEAQPGQLLQDCGWEYFIYQSGPDADCGGDPCNTGFLRLIAIADTDNGPFHPSCLADGPGELARIQFLVTDDPSYECQFVPVEFWWYDCADNIVADGLDPDTITISARVYASWGTDITQDLPFPTNTGAPSECLDGINGTPAVRGVYYHNGGLDIVCADSIDNRGDLNLNEIANEIADWVLFREYFLHGLEVFTVNLDMQIHASDVNADLQPLTLDDWVYLARVIVGDALPFPSPPRSSSSDTAVIVQDTLAQTVSVNYNDSLRALYLLFDGEIEPTFAPGIDSFENDYHFDSSFTRMLIHDGLNLTTIDSGLLFTYAGDGQIFAAYASYSGLVPIPTAIEGSSGSCCLVRGNMDGDMQGKVNIADIVSLVRYIFEDGSPPPCYPEGNVDGDPSESISIVDLVYLVDYLFRGGAAPPPCP